MISTIQLFQLVKSLSKEEKRFFKLNATYNSYKGEKQYYLHLFDLLDAIAGDFDEKLFRRQHRQENWFSSYANLKKYLYDALIKSLLAQQQQKNNFMQVSSLLQSAYLLRERGLYQQSEMFLDDAQTAAQKADMQAFIPLIIYQKMLLYTAFMPQNNPNNNIQLFSDLGQSLSLASQSAQMYFEQYGMYHQLFNFYSLFNAGLADNSAEQLKAIKTNLAKYADDADNQQMSIATKMYYLRNRTLLQIFSDSDDTRNYNEEIVLLFEAQPEFAQQKPRIYANALSNLISACTAAKKFEEAARYLPLLDYRLPVFKKNTGHDNVMQHFHFITLYINFYVVSGQLQPAHIFYQQQKQWIKDNYNALPLHSRLMAHFWIGCLYFETKDFAVALEEWAVFFGKLLPTARTFQNTVLLLRLLLIWQQKEWELLLYRCNQTKRILKKQSEWGVFHQMLFKFLYRSCSQPLRCRKAFRLWHQFLINYSTHQASSEGNNLFDYQKWAKKILAEK